MSALGHGEPSGPIHTEGGMANIAIPGDSANTTARLTFLLSPEIPVNVTANF